MEIGRMCVKIAGRDAGKKCVIVNAPEDGKFVLIDGETRRRKCNIKHLEPLEEKIKIKKGASHDTIVSEFKKLGIEIKEKKKKEKKERPRKTREKKEKAGKKKAAEKKEKKQKGKLADKLETGEAEEAKIEIERKEEKNAEKAAEKEKK